MVPSVGRAVHYVARGSADGIFPSACRAATITDVLGDPSNGEVSLCVMNPTGLFFNERVQYSHTPLPGTWHWPERTPDE